MAPTAQTLIRELIRRFGALSIATPTSAGTTTTLVDTALNEWLPNNLTQFSAWVYGSYTADSTNRGVQRRARSWTPGTSTMVFYNAWPEAPSVGEYEVIRHLFDRTRFLEAVNSAVGSLGLFWYRDVVDESLTTETQTWAYTIPASLNLFADSVDVFIQVTDTYSDFPYARASSLGIGYTVRESINAIGGRQLTLQFANNTMLPPNRTIRLQGVGYYATVDNDTDIVPLAGPWETAATQWIYDYAKYRINEWLADDVPAGETDKYRTKQLTALMAQRDDIQSMMMPKKNGRIVTPGREGVYGGRWGTDWRYLGAFNTPGI